MGVDRQASHRLGLAFSRLPGLGGMQGEAVVADDLGHGAGEDRGDVPVARKGEVVGIAGIGGIKPAGEACEA